MTGAPGAGRRHRFARGTAALVLAGVALVCAACGGGHHVTAQELDLERTDLVAVSHGLSAVEPTVRSQVATAKAAWPSVLDGLPRNPHALPRAAVLRAAEGAAAIGQPGVFSKGEYAELTGPGSPLVAAFRAYSVLCARAWQLIAAAIDQIEHGSTVAARFARANVALYIESAYDANFGVAQIGKQLVAGYLKLGGPAAFGSSLTQREVDALALAYSEADNRLQPHGRVRLGS